MTKKTDTSKKTQVIIRPDPAFKAVTIEEAKNRSLISGPTGTSLLSMATFCSGNSPEWRNCVIELAKRNNLKLLILAMRIRPKEFKKVMSISSENQKIFEAMEAGLTSEERQLWYDELSEVTVEYFIELLNKEPSNIFEALASKIPELNPKLRQQLIKLLSQEDNK